MNEAFHRLFICYRLSKSLLYIFTTGYANVTAYKKRACSPKIVAKSGGRFDCSFPKKGGGAIEHFAEKQPDTTRTLTLTRQRHIAPGRTRRRVQGRRKPLQKKHKIQLSLHIVNRAFSKNTTICKKLL